MKKYLFLCLSLGFLATTSTTLTSCCETKKIAKQHNDMQDVYDRLKEELPEAKVTFEEEKVKVVLPEAVLFQVNEANINPSYLPSIARMAKVLNKYPKTSVLVTGYTDISGTDELNNELSWKRAESAKAALLSNQVANKRVYTWGFGSKNPIASNDTEEGRKQNRRVEFVVLYDYQGEKK